ncbi:hypothetical protein CBR_g38241 [Chara braunii]|uniref:Protein odr-4 homolog n=1 Tax=Chara braunii TaxID=69332 RepID=A0A388LPK3_CHABU|nr:hypothetical protein CBR_g38241 [Chara braunii]|eukprot:GBG84270.1 hypothetical protein CBR_g38241 [Chara braunii]
MVVHSVVAQGELLDRHVDSLFRQGVYFEVGLLIGRSAEGNRSHLYVLVPTPSNEDGGGKEGGEGNGGSSGPGVGVAGGGKGRHDGKQAAASLPILDSDWIGEHARQVCRLLPGGIQVLGVYVFGTEPVFKSLAAALNSTLYAVCQAILSECNDSFSNTKVPDDMLLLHVCSSPKKYSCKSCPSGSGTTPLVGMKPCEMKFGNVLGSLRCCSNRYKVDIRMPLISEKLGRRYSLRSAIDAAISKESVRLHYAISAVDDGLLVDDALVGTLFDTKADGGAPYGRVEVLFLLPPIGSVHTETSDSCESTDSTLGPENSVKEDEVIGMIAIRGTVQGVAYAHVREPVRRLIADLKGDVIRSLRTRLDVLYDEIEREQTEENEVSGPVETSTSGENPEARKPRHALLLSADENG